MLCLPTRSQRLAFGTHDRLPQQTRGGQGLRLLFPLDFFKFGKSESGSSHGRQARALPNDELASCSAAPAGHCLPFNLLQVYRPASAGAPRPSQPSILVQHRRQTRPAALATLSPGGQSLSSLQLQPPGSRQAKTMPNNSNYRGLAQGSPLALNPLGTTCSSALFHAGSTD